MTAAFLSRLSKLPVVLLTAAAFALVAAATVWLAVARLQAVIDDSVSTAVSLKEAQWQAQIDAANLTLALAAADQARQAMRLNGELLAAREDARQAQQDLETANAALPDGDRGGLDHARVRLLNNP